MADPVGVSVAFSDGPLEPAPTWTQLDLTDNLVAGYSIRRGRTDEFDRTGTGTAQIAANDTGGLNSEDFDGKQAALALHNPVTDSWATIFRGLIDDYVADVDPSVVASKVTMSLVDGLDYLAGYELQPGVDGDSAPLASTLFYEETTAGFPGSETVDYRINKVLNDALWPTFGTGLRKIFTGNVKLQRTVYAAGTSALTVIDEAADAEFPGIANRFVDKDGAFVFHGRLARFNPEDIQYSITTWKVGDEAAFIADSEYTQMRGLTYSRSRNRVINSALITPQGVRPEDVAGLLQEDTGSQALYGRRGFAGSADNLRILNSVLTLNDANEECRLYADYFVSVYNEPRTRVDQITFRTAHPADPRAANVWALLCGVDISDRIQLKCSTPEREFNDEMFFVEGITYTVDPMVEDFANVTLTLDLSPAAYYDFPWE